MNRVNIAQELRFSQMHLLSMFSMTSQLIKNRIKDLPYALMALTKI